MRRLWAALTKDPAIMCRVHGWLTIFWFAAAFPIMVWWSENIKFLVFISVYAVVAGHWASYQAAHAEKHQEGG